EYMRARAEDLTGVARQVVAALTGGGAATLSGAGIVVAPRPPPPHTAPLARGARGTPPGAGLGEPLLEVPEGTELLLDGDAGTVEVEPADELVADYERGAAERDRSGRADPGGV